MELKPPTLRLELLCHVAAKVAAPQMIGAELTVAAPRPAPESKKHHTSGIQPC